MKERESTSTTVGPLQVSSSKKETQSWYEVFRCANIPKNGVIKIKKNTTKKNSQLNSGTAVSIDSVNSHATSTSAVARASNSLFRTGGSSSEEFQTTSVQQS
jgi:hypothetical protein